MTTAPIVVEGATVKHDGVNSKTQWLVQEEERKDVGDVINETLGRPRGGAVALVTQRERAAMDESKGEDPGFYWLTAPQFSFFTHVLHFSSIFSFYSSHPHCLCLHPSCLC